MDGYLVLLLLLLLVVIMFWLPIQALRSRAYGVAATRRLGGVADFEVLVATNRRGERVVALRFPQYTTHLLRAGPVDVRLEFYLQPEAASELAGVLQALAKA